MTHEVLRRGDLRLWFEIQLITPAGTRGLVFQGQNTTAGPTEAAS